MNKVARQILITLLSLLLLAYIVFQIYRSSHSSVTTETVTRYTAYRTIDTEGVAVRDEHTIDTTAEGYLYYLIEDGTRVFKTGAIAQAFDDEQDALGQQKIKELEEQIAHLEAIDSQRDALSNSFTVINKQIHNTVLETIDTVNEARYDDLYARRADLTDILNKRSVMVGVSDDFSAYKAMLTKRLEEHKQADHVAKKTVSAPVSGYFVSEIDGFETVLTTDRLKDITAEQVKECLDAKPSTAESKIGKVVGDYEWYVLCIVPAEDVPTLMAGSALNICMPFVSSQTIPMTVKSVSRDKEGNFALVLGCSYMSEKLSSIRRETIQIRAEEYEGLKIPKDAIAFDDQNRQGVFVRKGNSLTFKLLDVVFSNAEYCISAEHTEKEYVQLYDDIVTKGKDLYDGKIVD